MENTKENNVKNTESARDDKPLNTPATLCHDLSDSEVSNCDTENNLYHTESLNCHTEGDARSIYTSSEVSKANFHKSNPINAKKQGYLIGILFICLFLSLAKNVFFYTEKDMLENAYIESQKALSLHKDFITDIHSYIKAVYSKDIALDNTFLVFIDYMEHYSTPTQKGKSSKFMKEINATLSQEIANKEAEKEAQIQAMIEAQNADLSSDENIESATESE